jgi:hypothetical protein
MSAFLYHTSCSSCGSRDNLGVYTDHKFCFGCGFTENFSASRRRREAGVRATVPEKQLWLPDDIVTTIPHQADSWIRQYNLTQKELYDNKVVWSEKQQLLIFLYQQAGILLGWQGRYFGKDNKPKWWNQGNLKDIDKIINSSMLSTSIVLVEDIISAIKVGRQYGTKPLFGSYIDIANIYKLYKKYNTKKIVLWLDKDKQRHAYQTSVKLNSIGINSNVIVTLKDPKEYNNEEIRKIYESTIGHTTATT